MWRLDHVQLAIPPDAETRCDNFYVGVLGLNVVEKPAPLAERGGRWYERESLQLHLGVDENFRAATKAHPALAVDDYDALRERCRSAGVTWRDDDALAGVRRGYVLDPVGNRIEIIDASSSGPR